MRTSSPITAFDPIEYMNNTTESESSSESSSPITAYDGREYMDNTTESNPSESMWPQNQLGLESQDQFWRNYVALDEKGKIKHYDDETFSKHWNFT